MAKKASKQLTKSEPRTQRSGVGGGVERPLTPLRYVRGSDNKRYLVTISRVVR